MAKDARTHAKARALYEAGESFAKIAPKVKSSVRALKGWCKSEGWVKGEKAPDLHRKAELALEAEAERHGVTKGKVLAKVAELIDANSLAVITTQGAVSLCPMLPTATIEGGKGEFQGLQYDVVPDRKTQMEAAKLAADVLGMKRSGLDITSGGRSLLDEVLDEA